MNKYIVPKGLKEAIVKGFRDCQTGEKIYDPIGLAVVEWLVEDWEKSPNSVRMPNPWYNNSLEKWDQFCKQWNCKDNINFVDLLIFFRNRFNEQFIDPEHQNLIDIANELTANPEWRSADLYHALLKAFRLGEKSVKNDV